MKKVLLSISAVVFFVLGVIGLLIPVIPQIPFFVVSVLLMSAASERFRKAFTQNSLYKKYLEKYVVDHPNLAAMLGTE